MALPHFPRILRAAVAFSFVCFLQPAWGQFTVVSTSPADGATAVDTAATFEITFSAALDTSARFEWPGQFFLGILIHPDTLTGDPDSITVSPDLRTVRVHNIHLWANTRYVFAIVGARSLGGASLDMPAVITITTGSALPTGKVSGTISFPGNDPTATMVALFRNLFSDENPEAMAVVPSSAGTYTVNYVPAGTYWPVALKDVNKSGSFDPDTDIDAVGVYDPNGDGFLDSVVVLEGGSLSGINITLTTLAGLTARQRYPTLQTASQNWSADARLVALGADGISVAGKAGFWMYSFYSPSRAEYASYLASSSFLAFFPAQDEDMPDTTALPEDWIDSDVAVDSAEVHGGSQFRATYADAEIFGWLANWEMFGAPPQANVRHPVVGFRHEMLPSVSRMQVPSARAWQNQAHLLKHPPLAMNALSSAADIRAVWMVSYFSHSGQDYLDVLLDARTGEFIEPFTPTGTTAHTNVQAANQAGMMWAADAQLVLVGALQSLSPTGESMAWVFVYYSAAKDSARNIYLMSGIVVGQESPSLEQLPSKEALPLDWIDSNAAIGTAEASGGSQFRSAYSDAGVSALLSRNLLPGDPSRAIWKFMYYSASAQQVLDLLVDALTGSLIVSVDEKPPMTHKPEAYALAQNYPNPLNPTTKIEYQLPQASHVSLGIYSLTGQLVRKLVEAKQPAGSHAVEWDGRDQAGRAVASGVYLYRVVAGQFAKTRKMVVIR